MNQELRNAHFQQIGSSRSNKENQMEIYIYKNGERCGPFTREQILAQLQCGMINERDPAWHKGKKQSLRKILAAEPGSQSEHETPRPRSAAKWSVPVAAMIAASSAYYFGMIKMPYDLGAVTSQPHRIEPTQIALPTGTGPLANAKNNQLTSNPTPSVSPPKAPDTGSVPKPIAEAIKITDSESPKTDLSNAVMMDGTNQATPQAAIQRGTTYQDRLKESDVVPSTRSDADYVQAKALDQNKNATKEDVDQAIACYRKSVTNGNTLAMMALADLLLKTDYEGYKIEIDQLYTQAAAGGNPAAILHNSSKVTSAKEYSSALTKAAAFGSARACLMLKNTYAGQNHFLSRFTDQVQPSPAVALQWQLLYDFLYGFTTNNQTQQMKRATLASDVQSAEQMAAAFIAENHLKQGQSFERISEIIEFFSNAETAAPPSVEKPEDRPVALSPAPVPSIKAIALPRNWSSTFQASSGGGSKTMADLSRLLSPFGEPDSTLECASPQTVYAGIPYLTPVDTAIKQLKLTSLKSKSKISCAGLPDGLFYYAFDGKFEGHYNKLYLVTDQKDQVVSVELVEESPKGGQSSGNHDRKNHTYDFVNTRCKLLVTMVIAYEVDAAKETESNAHVVNLTLYDPTMGKTLKAARWYVPQPLVNLILYCVSQAQKR